MKIVRRHVEAEWTARCFTILLALTVSGVSASSAGGVKRTSSSCGLAVGTEAAAPLRWQLIDRLAGLEASGIAPVSRCSAIVIGARINGTRSVGAIMLITILPQSVKAAAIPSGIADLRAIAVHGSNAWAAGANQAGRGVVLMSRDSGAHWQRISRTPFLQGLRGISFADDTHGWVVDTTKIYRTANGGVRWTAQTLPRAMTFISDVLFADPNDGVAVGVAGSAAAVLETLDGGARWTIRYRGQPGSFFRVSRSAGCTIASGGNTSGSIALLATSPDQSTWRSIAAPAGAGTAFGAWCSATRQVVAVRFRTGSAIFVRTLSKPWRRARVPSSLSAGQIVFGYGQWWLAGDGGVFISPLVR
jgi:hypothetical protein